jgi:ABC-type lipoprotein release transport system permease subunit
MGHMMTDGAGNKITLDTEIVGIVRDNKHAGVRENVVPTFFRPIKQNPAPAALFFYVRTFADPAQALTTVSGTMQRLDPSLVLANLRTMEGQIDDELSNERMVSLLAVSFGILTTLLAGIGLYGVLAYSTAQRTQEIGIRIALGSTRLAVSRIVLGDVLRLAGIGVAVALPVSYLLSRLLRSQLFGVSPADPLTIVGAVLLISVVTLFAALVPARRAAAINPIEALRTE